MTRKDEIWKTESLTQTFLQGVREGIPFAAEQISEEFAHRRDKEANILAPVELQCEWLREIGFEDVDCYFKVFEFAVFGGRRPKKEV